jgi:protein SCO1/2
MAAVATAAAVAVLAVVAFESRQNGGNSLPPVRVATPYRGSEPPGRNVLPQFELPTYDGRPMSAPALRRRVVVVTFVDTACTESCPIIVTTIARALRRLDRRTRSAVAAVAFSVDPKVDTPSHIRAFLRARHADREVAYVVAPERRMRPVWTAFHVLPAVDTGNADMHSADVRVFDRDGVWVSTLHAGVDLTAANLAHDVRTAFARS